MALAVEKHILDSGSIDTVGTVGASCFLLTSLKLWFSLHLISFTLLNFCLVLHTYMSHIYVVEIILDVFQGILELHPGAINSIPSKSHLEIGTDFTVIKIAK